MFAFGGLKRTYILHVPPGPPTGLVLNLHGGGSSGAGQQRLTDFDSAADANNLLVVYPNGYDKSWADGRGPHRPTGATSMTTASWWP
ncbi:putative secreted hydrolase domain protein [Mycobacterium ulcerans str. Harvey]|uniref:Secreted hydrolase domain protein n=1 Tax=Mycobacterium ulcerans str. Harvey TaxID=1299332 RepID=A0ABP3AIN4_MYCUL|nr:putative secreted hydrolase domain protein [Mycobacterium ulcerans str. Harvey]